MTLRRRLTLLSALAVGATVVLAAVVAYVATRAELRGQIDDSLRAQAGTARLRDLDRLATRRAQRPGLVGEPSARTGLPPALFTYVRPDGSSEQLRGSELPLPLSVDDRTVAAGGGSDAVLSDRSTGGVHLRVLTVPLPAGGAVVLARSLQSVDTVLSRLRLLLAALCVAGTRWPPR